MIKFIYFKHDKTPKRIERITKSEEHQAKKRKRKNIVWINCKTSNFENRKKHLAIMSFSKNSLPYKSRLSSKSQYF